MRLPPITRKARKAFVGAAATAVGTAGGAMLDGDLTGIELVASIGTGLAAFAAVYATPKNADA